ncbi:MAG: ELM1/GtrOC1 family putative glycosyltransferase [Reinekea sp.]
MASKIESLPLVWITKTSRDGDTNARIGIAERINSEFFQLEIPSEFCTKNRARERLIEARLIHPENPRWPDVIIGPCFHIPYMQIIKTLSNGKTLVVALRPPVRGLPIKADREDIEKTDIIVSYPYHDNTCLPNIILCDTVANRVSTEKLRTKKIKWEPYFNEMSKNRPLIGLLVGGDIGDKRKVFPPEVAKKLGGRINRTAQQVGGFLFITTSARTSIECKDAICSEITVPYAIFDPKTSSDSNPYLGLLACAEFLVVTADSMSMSSEAVSSHKPVYIFYDQEIVEETHSLVTKKLIESGYARFLGVNTTLDRFDSKHKNSAEIIAKQIHCFLSEKTVPTTKHNNHIYSDIKKRRSILRSAFFSR